jgi:hypothetical protein
MLAMATMFAIDEEHSFCPACPVRSLAACQASKIADPDFAEQKALKSLKKLSQIRDSWRKASFGPPAKLRARMCGETRRVRLGDIDRFTAATLPGISYTSVRFLELNIGRQEGIECLNSYQSN